MTNRDRLKIGQSHLPGHVYESQGYSKVDGETIKSGDFISIDGWSGAVYTGKHEIGADESYKIVL